MNRPEDGRDLEPTASEGSLDLLSPFLARLGDEDLAGDGGRGGASEHEELLDRLALRQALAVRYEEVKLLGRGGMGEVHEVRDVELGRPLAMKVLSEAHRERSSVDRFLEEAQVTGQLDHPGIVPVHELGVAADGRLFFTMQLVRGHDLSAVFADREPGTEWTTTRLLQVLLRVCEALSFAHDKGVLHRDLKPANIMVGRFGEVYVMDWGLAKVIGRSGAGDVDEEQTGAARSVVQTLRGRSQDASATLEGDVLGTPAYMSPEQARGELEGLDARTDVYSLGALLYHALAGAAPYRDEADTALAVLRAVRAGPPRPLARIAPGTPPELVAICERAMERRTADRYPGALELAADLRAYLEGRVVLAHGTGAFIEARKWIQRNRAVAAVTCALALAITLGFVVSSVLFFEARRNERELQLASVDLIRTRFRRLIDEEPTLWPPGPTTLPALEAWVAEAHALLADAPQLLGTLEGHSPDDPRVAELSALCEDLRQLDDPDSGLLGADTPENGLSVLHRRDLARDAEWSSIGSPDAKQLWAAACAAIADPQLAPAYGGDLDLVPQLGLIPLGQDLESGLWEFGHPASGDLAKRDTITGALQVGEATGLVFVLVPAGQALIGSSNDPEHPRYVPDLPEDIWKQESPLSAVALDAFFLSKFELSQAQWQRWTSAQPSYNKPGDVFDGRRVTLQHPVEMVSWTRAVEVLERFDFRLPTEAQWEYAARGGTDFPWWTGPDASSLRGKVNLLDLSAERGGVIPAREPGWTDVDDGWPVHAPVSSGAANPFGFVHILGNVHEWCQDGRTTYAGLRRGAQGVAITDARERVFRGGSFYGDSSAARSASRASKERAYADSVIGIRPMRRVNP